MRTILALIVLAVTTAHAAAGDLPTRKSGLWEIKMQGAGLPQGMVSQQCVDASTDQLLQQQSQDKTRQQCSKNEVHKQGNKVIVDSQCKFNSTTATTHAEFSGDFTRDYHGDIETSFDPPLHGMKSSKQSFEGKWLGACKPGQKPGDIILPGRNAVNLNDIMKNLPEGKRPNRP